MYFINLKLTHSAAVINVRCDTIQE